MWKKRPQMESAITLLLGENFDERKYITTYYNPMWGSLLKIEQFISKIKNINSTKVEASIIIN